MSESLEKKSEKLINGLEANYQRYWEFFNFAPDGYLVTDIEGTIKEVNQTLLNMLATTQSDLLGKSITELIPNIKQFDFGVQLNWFANPQNLEVYLQPPGRTPFFASLNIAPQRDLQNKTTGLLWLLRDVTKRIEAENILFKSERFNSNLLKNSPNPIVVINADTSVAYVNPAFEGLTGFPFSQVIGQKAPFPWWIKEDIPQKLASYRKTLEANRGKVERQYQKQNGDRFWAEVTTNLINDEEEPAVYLHTWVDISEAKRLKENLESYMIQITRVQEEERKRIAQELHEETLQSLAALCLAIEAIIKSDNQNPQETNQNLQELREKINGVIGKVRQFSYGLRPGVLDYLGLTAALETLTEDLNEKGIKSYVLVSGKEKILSPDMEINLFRITQEAVSNIKKYSNASKVKILLYYMATKIKLRIEDNGQGFNLPEQMSELAGQGKLGLIGIEERAHLYRGYFSIRSQPGKGTKVMVSLPINNERKHSKA